jgi:hypothetical protein
MFRLPSIRFAKVDVEVRVVNRRRHLGNDIRIWMIRLRWRGTALLKARDTK